MSNNTNYKGLLKKTIFSATVAISLFAAAIFGFYFGWGQIKRPMLVALTFHGVTEKPSYPWEIHPEPFDSFIRQFRRHEFTPIAPASLPAMLDQGFSGRHFLVSFDDGLITSAEAIRKLYRDYGIKSVLFIITDLVGTPGYVDRPTLLDLQNNFGCHIALHGKRHYEVTKILQEGGDLTGEIEKARVDLSAWVRSVVDWYAYPYGDFNASAAAAIASTGIKLAFTIEGEEITPAQNRMLLPRVMYLKGAKEAGEPDPSDWLPPKSASNGSLTITLSLLVAFIGLSWTAKFLQFNRARKAAGQSASATQIQ